MMAVQIDGKTWGEARIARNDGNLTKVGEARVFEGGAWRTVYQFDPVKNLNPACYYRLQNTLTDEMGGADLTLGSSARLRTDRIDFNQPGSGMLTTFPAPTANTFTITMWARLATPMGGALWERGSDTDAASFFGFLDGDVLIAGAGTDYDWQTAPVPITTGTGSWNLYSFRFTRLSSTQVGATTGRNAITDIGNHAVLDRNPGPLSGPVILGTSISGVAKFDGAVSHVAFWDRELTPEEFAKVLAAGRY